MLDGNLVLFKGTWRSSLLIRWWTGGKWFSFAPYSHVGVLCHATLDGGKTKLCVMDATKSGTDPIPLDRYADYYGKVGGEIWIAPLLDEGMRQKVIERADEAWGAPYPPLWQWLYTAFRGWTGGTDPYPGFASCQELVAHCYNLKSPTGWFPWEILESTTDDLVGLHTTYQRLFGTPVRYR